MIRTCIAILVFLFPAFLFAQTKTFAGTDYLQGITFAMENNQIVWQHKAPDSNDLWVLSNGNILFTIGHGVLEMTRQDDIISHYESKGPVFACQRSKSGNTLVGECATGRMLEISPKGMIVKEVCILPEGVKEKGSASMRNAQRLDNGHFLVARYDPQCVTEYDMSEKVVRNLDVSGGPHSLTRLFNGYTLTAVADKDQNPRLIEVTAEGKTVWELSNADTPGKLLKFLGDFQYFSDGCFLIINWTGHVNPKEEVYMLLVDRQKKILYSLENTPGLETMSSAYSMDIPAGVTSYH